MAEEEAPVVHHVELCVADVDKAYERLHRYGFSLHATRTTPICRQLVTKLGSIFFVITERNPSYSGHKSSARPEPFTVFCCDGKPCHSVDSVFNVSFTVKNVAHATERVAKHGVVIQPPVTVSDKHGEISYSIVKSNCGNVCHTLLETGSYHGPFLVGYEAVCESESYSAFSLADHLNISFIDHVTLAVPQGQSNEVITFYEKSFGMYRYRISNLEDQKNGLILSGGIGLLLKAMEYYSCAETYITGKKPEGRNRNNIMLVVVETLKGQTHCNIDAFLKEHNGPGIEHVAINIKSDIAKTVTELSRRGVCFRKPPSAYYYELKKANQIRALGEDLDELERLGILLDNEEDSEEPNNSDPKCGNKYLMQIFALPFFDKKTFFFELIQRSGSARGLGTGNVIALVRSIREEEKRKAGEKNKAMKEEDIANPRKIC